MSELRAIRCAFEDRGYDKIPNVEVLTRGDIWYRHQSSNEDADHVIYLEFKPSSKAYGVLVGVANRNARRLVLDSLSLLEGFFHPAYLGDARILNQPCWNFFDGGRALQWDAIFVMPNPFDRTRWPALFESLFRDFVEPLFSEIRDAQGVLQLLLRDEPPFEWFTPNPVIRMVEIIAPGKLCGVERSVIKRELDSHRDYLPRPLAAADNSRDAIDILIDTVADARNACILGGA